MLPQAGGFGAQPGSGVAPPGSQPGFGGSQPGFGGSQPGFGGSQPGFGGSQPGFGGSQPGFGGSQPGFGTSPAGFGAPQSGFGTPPPGSGPVTAVPQAKRSGGGLAIGIVLVVLFGGLLLVGGLGVGAYLLLAPQSEADSDTANVRIQTDVQTGELLVDGVSRGPVTPNQQIHVDPGSHTLELRENGEAVATASVDVVDGSDETVVMNRPVEQNTNNGGNGGAIVPADQNTMVPGQTRTFNGSLRPSDAQLTSGEYMDTYEFQWTAGTVVQLDMHSSDFDSYLILKAPSGAQQDNDDRAAGNLDAGMTVTLNETGTWQIVCTSYEASTTGDYTLTVRGP